MLLWSTSSKLFFDFCISIILLLLTLLFRLHEVNLSIIRNNCNKLSAYNISSVGLIVWQNQQFIRVLIKIIILYENNILIIKFSEVWNSAYCAIQEYRKNNLLFLWHEYATCYMAVPANRLFNKTTTFINMTPLCFVPTFYRRISKKI